LAILASLLILVVAACDNDDTAETTTTGAGETTTTTAAPGVQITIPFLAQWEGSGHADATAEAFVHWNEDDPQEIPTSCAKCHSEGGYLDYIGADGSAVNVVDAAQPVGSTVTCTTCHNDVTVNMTSVLMPSGIELTGLGDESRCMQCHQGRESKVSVDAAIEGMPDDEVNADLGFRNIHYYAAAATKYGTAAKGGYEYDGKSYDAFFAHVEGMESCVECHDTHTLEVQFEECQACHAGVATPEDTWNIRMPGSLVDYDGDGNIEEGIYYELEGLRDKEYEGIRAYAADVAGTPITYDAGRYPYFFGDTNDNNAVDDGEEGYAAWTPRLLKAAYNYQVSLKDPGAFAHGGKYIIALLYDSLEDLNTQLSSPVDMTGMHRIDAGHFAGSEEAFRHWDEDDPAVVPATCTKCHSAEGLPLFLEQGVSINQPTANGFQCATCHSNVETFELRTADEVAFPSGAVISVENDITSPEMQLCISCHQGRESTVSVNRLIGDLGPNQTSDGLRFLNVHYFAAGATLFGTQVQGGYEYAGQTYVGRNQHVTGFQTCNDCHNTHALTVNVEACGGCHAGVESMEDLETIRISTPDYDGDGDATEGVAGEIETMQEKLLEALNVYTGAQGIDPIIYNPNRYPYYFGDPNGNGTIDEGEGAYATWTPRLLRAAYNYQYTSKDPGGFAHNPKYIMELLYDSLRDLGGSTAGMTRP
jgi:hypothetical protein